MTKLQILYQLAFEKVEFIFSIFYFTAKIIHNNYRYFKNHCLLCSTRPLSMQYSPYCYLITIAKTLWNRPFDYLDNCLMQTDGRVLTIKPNIQCMLNAAHFSGF